MPFEPGQSGNPDGTKKERKFIAALDRAIAQDDGKRLRDAAEKLLTHAANGEPWAIGMLADRLDGKPKQQVELETTLHDGDVSRTPMSAEEWEKKYGLAPAARTASSAH